MLSKEIVTNVIKQQRGIYAPHVVTKNGMAGLPDELIDNVNKGDEVIIFSAPDKLSYGGFCAIVINTTKNSLQDKLKEDVKNEALSN